MKTKSSILVLILVLSLLFANSCKKEEVVDNSDKIPILIVKDLTNISFNSATGGDYIISDNGFDITAKGICWSTEQNPTLEDDHTSDGIGNDNYVSKLTGLSENTTYYVRAYATNENGTAYSNNTNFTTLKKDNTLKDVDRNVYATVVIGSQTWMAENLKTTKLNDGTGILRAENNSLWEATTSPGYCYYDNDKETYEPIYEAIYNWYAVNTNKLCPEGWRIPNEDDWFALIDYLGGNTIAGGKLKEAGTNY